MVDIAKKFELDLMPDHSVRITLRCDSAYEASILHQEISEACKTGHVKMTFDLNNRVVER